MGRIDLLLHEISGIPSGNFSNEAERLSGSALAQLNFSDIDSLLLEGLHESIDQLQRKLIEVGQSIFETYVLLPFEIKKCQHAHNFSKANATAIICSLMRLFTLFTKRITGTQVRYVTVLMNCDYIH